MKKQIIMVLIAGLLVCGSVLAATYKWDKTTTTKEVVNEETQEVEIVELPIPENERVIVKTYETIEGINIANRISDLSNEAQTVIANCERYNDQAKEFNDALESVKSIEVEKVKLLTCNLE